MTTRRDCESCAHYRFTCPEPFSAADLRNPKVIEQLGEWRKYLNQREPKEDEELDRDETAFTFEPWFYAWCAHYSSPAPEAIHPRDRQGGTYVLTDAVNPDQDCQAYEPRTRAGAR